MTASPFVAGLRDRWGLIPSRVRAILFVSAGAMLLTIMAVFVKILGERLHPAQLMFSRAMIGFLIFAPWLLLREGRDVIRTNRPGMHLMRGFWGACGNYCFFFAVTHLVLADAMALQFSRPLFMIVLAFLFLGEVAGARRIGVTLAGFAGILIMLRPFGGGFDPDGIVAVAGALFGGLVVISIAAWFWIDPTWDEVPLLLLIGFLGIIGQSCLTHGFTLGEATVTVPFDYMRIVYSGIFGLLLFAEVPSWWSVAGATLIVGSNLYLMRRG